MPVSDSTGIGATVSSSPPIDFRNAPRNSPCPCGSGKKYKVCCQDQQRDHQLVMSALQRIPAEVADRAGYFIDWLQTTGLIRGVAHVAPQAWDSFLIMTLHNQCVQDLTDRQRQALLDDPARLQAHRDQLLGELQAVEQRLSEIPAPAP